jgi:hypothetical protein
MAHSLQNQYVEHCPVPEYDVHDFSAAGSIPAFEWLVFITLRLFLYNQ